MAQYILAIDQGTTGSTALIIDATRQELKVVGKDTVDFGLNYPHVGWVEQDLEDIWRSVREAIRGAIKAASLAHCNFSESQIIAIGITNQRETLAFFEKTTALPLRPAIVWQCKRSTTICQRMKQEGLEPELHGKTGLFLDPYFSASKLAWIFAHDEKTASLLKQGKAYFGTIDTFLLYKMTQGAVYATEPSNASRTMLFNIKTGAFDKELACMFNIPDSIAFPEVKDSAGPFGVTKGLDFLPDNIPISGILGDQQSALVGQGGFETGLGKCTYGTGAFLLMNTGSHPIFSTHGLLTTIAYKVNHHTTYALEGSAFIAGALVQFLRDQWHIIQNSSEMSDIPISTQAAPELYFVPALSGLGAPYWNPAAKGTILGLTRGTTKFELMLATLEGLSFQVYDLVKAMNLDIGSELKELRVDGGASINNRLLQIQADILNIKVNRPTQIETTALGAAYFAGLGIKRFQDFSEIESLRTIERSFEPNLTPLGQKHRQDILSGWERAIRATIAFANHS